MDETEIVVQVAQLLSDPLRLRIITLLAERPVTVSELTARTGAHQARVSSHLALLRRAGWTRTSSYGQQRHYQLASPLIAEAIRALGSVPIASGSHEPKERPRSGTSAARSLQVARTCYTHLAGQAGVALCERLLAKGWIVPTENKAGKYQPGFALTEAGREGLQARGVVIPKQKSRRQFAYACPDWMEPGPHLGGALGEAILHRLEELELVCRRAETREVVIEGDLIGWLD
jgi:DNA-binding transcriptional ArsR family regulator